MTKQLCIAGTSSGVGKTTVTMAILSWLSSKMQVQPFKVGPDYIDPMFHTAVTGMKSRNLDTFLMDNVVVKELFCKHSQNADISIIEGVMGFYDGKEVGSDVGTTASVAKLTGSPVILIVDGAKAATSVAAVVKGFIEFDREVNFGGVIVNRVGSKMHYELIKEAIEYYTGVPVVGYLLNNTEIALSERHLGLIPTDEVANIEIIKNRLKALAHECFDMEALLKIATTAKKNEHSNLTITQVHNKSEKYKVRIAYAKDRAFSFYYEDNLDYMREMGIELLPFSPLEDQCLPDDIHGIIFGGGFPEVFADELEANVRLRTLINEKLTEGMPYYAECGGLMYLCESIISLEGERREMVGWLSGYTKMCERLQRFGYASLTIEEACVFGRKGEQIKVHEFHHSEAHVDEAMVYKLYKEKKGRMTSSWQCGYKKGNGVAAYAHLHFYSNESFVKNFYQHCLEYRNR